MCRCLPPALPFHPPSPPVRFSSRTVSDRPGPVGLRPGLPKEEAAQRTEHQLVGRQRWHTRREEGRQTKGRGTIGESRSQWRACDPRVTPADSLLCPSPAFWQFALARRCPSHVRSTSDGTAHWTVRRENTRGIDSQRAPQLTAPGRPATPTCAKGVLIVDSCRSASTAAATNANARRSNPAGDADDGVPPTKSWTC